MKSINCLLSTSTDIPEVNKEYLANNFLNQFKTESIVARRCTPFFLTFNINHAIKINMNKCFLKIKCGLINPYTKKIRVHSKLKEPCHDRDFSRKWQASMVRSDCNDVLFVCLMSPMNAYIGEYTACLKIKHGVKFLSNFILIFNPLCPAEEVSLRKELALEYVFSPKLIIYTPEYTEIVLDNLETTQYHGEFIETAKYFIGTMHRKSQMGAERIAIHLAQNIVYSYNSDRKRMKLSLKTKSCLTRIDEFDKITDPDIVEHIVSLIYLTLTLKSIGIPSRIVISGAFMAGIKDKKLKKYHNSIQHHFYNCLINENEFCRVEICHRMGSHHRKQPRWTQLRYNKRKTNCCINFNSLAKANITKALRISGFINDSPPIQRLCEKQNISNNFGDFSEADQDILPLKDVQENVIKIQDILDETIIIPAPPTIPVELPTKAMPEKIEIKSKSSSDLDEFQREKSGDNSFSSQEYLTPICEDQTTQEKTEFEEYKTFKTEAKEKPIPPKRTRFKSPEKPRMEKFTHSTLKRREIKKSPPKDQKNICHEWNPKIKIDAPSVILENQDLEGNITLYNICDNMTKHITFNIIQKSVSDEITRNLFHTESLVRNNYYSINFHVPHEVIFAQNSFVFDTLKCKVLCHDNEYNNIYSYCHNIAISFKNNNSFDVEQEETKVQKNILKSRRITLESCSRRRNTLERK